MFEKVWKYFMDIGIEVMGFYGMGGVLEWINIKFFEYLVDGVDIVIFVVVFNELRVEII